MKNRNLPIDDNWITPASAYDPLNMEFDFDHDPCPYNEGVVTPEKDGLLNDWGERNFINPPYRRYLKEAFVRKAIQQAGIGKLCVLLLPVSTSTALFHDYIKPNAKEIRFVRGRIKFQKKDPNGNLYTPKNGGMHDSMIVVLKTNKLQNKE